MRKFLFQVLVFLVCFLAVGWFCRKQTDGFTILKISSDLTHHIEWETPPLSEVGKAELKKKLDQPFTYLARGDQCFVFVSQDQKYVLKFFRQNRMRAPVWVKWLPTFMGEFRERRIATEEAKLKEDFTSYLLAYNELKEETGLIYLHLNKTNELNTTVTIIDKLGVAHSLPLDPMEFLLQKNARLLYPALEEFIRKGEMENAKTTLTELVHLLKRRYENGLLDKDPDLNTNFGCIGTTPVQIDIGRFKRDQRVMDLDPHREILRITDNLHQWLELRCLELDHHLLGEIAQIPGRY